jgi:hypothetical protein
MRPDANTRVAFKDSYQLAAIRADELSRALEKWQALLRTRLRLQMRLAWLQAVAGETSAVEAELTLQRHLAAFGEARRAVEAPLPSGVRFPTEGDLRNDVDQLLEEINNAATRLPELVERQGPNEPVYSDQQAALIHLGLLHEPIRYNGDRLPNMVYATDSGVGEKSSVLFFSAATQEPMVVAAKFDDYHRSEREWEQIEQLRKLDLPPRLTHTLRSV